MKKTLLSGFCLLLMGCLQPDTEQLSQALEERDGKKVQRLVTRNAPLYDPAVEEQPRDLIQDNREMLRIVFTHLKDVDQVVNGESDSLLIWAVKEEVDSELLQILLDRQPDLQYRNSTGLNAFEAAVIGNNFDAVMLILEQAGELPAGDFSPLPYALEHGFDRQVLYYCEKGLFFDSVEEDDLLRSLIIGWPELYERDAIIAGIKDNLGRSTLVFDDDSAQPEGRRNKDLVVLAVKNGVVPEIVDSLIKSDPSCLDVFDEPDSFLPLTKALELGYGDLVVYFLDRSLFLEELYQDSIWGALIAGWENLEQPLQVRNRIMDVDTDVLPDALWDYLGENRRNLDSAMDLPWNAPYISNTDRLRESFLGTPGTRNYAVFIYDYQLDRELILMGRYFSESIGRIPAQTHFALVDYKERANGVWFKVLSDDFQSGWIKGTEYPFPETREFYDNESPYAQRNGPLLTVDYNGMRVQRVNTLAPNIDGWEGHNYRFSGILANRIIDLTVIYYEGRGSELIDTVSNQTIFTGASGRYYPEQNILVSLSAFYGNEEYSLSVINLQENQFSKVISTTLFPPGPISSIDDGNPGKDSVELVLTMEEVYSSVLIFREDGEWKADIPEELQADPYAER